MTTAGADVTFSVSRAWLDDRLAEIVRLRAEGDCLRWEVEQLALAFVVALVGYGHDRDEAEASVAEIRAGLRAAGPKEDDRA